jgi:hypothetical protein
VLDGSRAYVVRKATGPYINPERPLKHYWMLVKGLPFRFHTKQYLQRLLKNKADVIELDWYNMEWLDNKWLRAKLAMAHSHTKFSVKKATMGPAWGNSDSFFQCRRHWLHSS